ncbi:MAG: hypothetical protein KF824_06415 [Fimbriimonadaceae bacterium]|nr:MAG: hypothetical protein KF824_06415 [Fimbriimonadaceae bacterium]
MYLERKLATASMVVLAVTAAFAVAQVGPARQGSGGQSSSTPAAASGVLAPLKMTPMQDVMNHIITWEQSIALNELGGTSPDYNALPQRTIDARMEVVRACNLYLRATLTPSQQETYDRVILDPVGHPLPSKWEKMRLKGTLVSELLKSDAKQFEKAKDVQEAFLERQHAIWGTGHKNGGYIKNHNLLISDFRGILSKTQLAEFNELWSNYKREVDAAKASAVIKP